MKIFLKNNFIFFLLIFIIGLGLFLRFYLILSRNIFTDEVFYWEIARTNSVLNIIRIDHWIKDHGILYYLFLKPFLFLATDIIFLRFTNLVLYILSSLFIFLFFYQLGFSYLSLLPVVLFSLNRYFIYLNSMISPYNLAFFFALGSILSLFYYLFNDDNKRFKTLSYFCFIFFTILGFYANYSFFYMFFFYLIVILYIMFYKQKLLLTTLIAYQFVLILILPGFFQFLNNFDKITYLFNATTYKNTNFLSFFNDINRILIFRQNKFFSSLYLIILLVIPFLIKIKKNIFLIKINFILILAFLLNILLQFVFINYFFSIFVDRSFWYFYLSLIIIISINLLIFFYEKKFLFFWFLIITFIIFSIFNHFKPGKMILGEISEETLYVQLVKHLITEKNTPKKVIFIDKGYHFYPLTNYFFSNNYPSSGKFYKEINNFKQGVDFNRVESLYQIDENELKTKNRITLVLFSYDQSELEYLINFRNKYNNNLDIYYTKAISDKKDGFFKL